jgi:hypothetical protein
MIDVIVRYAQSSQGGSYTGLETLGAAQETNKTRARFSWKQYDFPIVFSNLDIAKNGGEGKIEDLLKIEMEEAKEDMKHRFASHIFQGYTNGLTGNGGKDIDSLVGACDDGSNVATYGGIDRTTYNWWDGQYDNESGVLSIAQMRTTYSSLKEKPDMIVTTPDGFDAYEALLTANLQYITNMVGKTGDPTFSELKFRGTPIEQDEYCTAQNMYMLNTKYLGFRVLKHPDFATSKEGLAMTDLQRPVNQDGKVGYILWYGNLICTQPRKQGRIYGITNA